MPELPDVTVYVEALERRVVGETLAGIRLASPFLLQSVAPPPEAAAGRTVAGVRRLGKRVVMDLEGDLHLVIHLMIAGRLRWLEAGAPIPRRLGLCAFDFAGGTLLLTEAGTKKRASLHVVQGAADLAAFDRGGVEPRQADLAAYTAALRGENHTLKRSLTDPRLFSGIGNAYSDEILHRARLSPLQRSGNLSDEEISRLREAARDTLRIWTERLREEARDGFPVGVTAFRREMAVHGRFREPCPDCGSEVQRIRYAENEANYCPACQTGGKLLADRGLSRLLREDWPRNLDELDRLRARARGDQSPEDADDGT